MNSMKRFFVISSAVILAVSLSGCTQNSRAKKFGGTATVELPKHQKLVTATWRNDDLWYLTRPMREGEAAEAYILREDSSYGLVEGKVIFREVK